MPFPLHNESLRICDRGGPLILRNRGLERIAADRFWGVTARLHNDPRASFIATEPEYGVPIRRDRECRDDPIFVAEANSWREWKRKRPGVIPDIAGFLTDQPDVRRVHQHRFPVVWGRRALRELRRI